MKKILKEGFTYKLLRKLKNSFNLLILPDSIAVLKDEQKKIRTQVIKLVKDNAGLVLDIGSGNRPASNFSKIIKMDIDPGCPVDIVADAHNIPFLKNTFDLVWLGGVLEHIKKPEMAIREIHRVTRKDGYIYIEAPFFQRIHGAPDDFQRFTISGIEELCSQFSKIKSGIICGPSSAFAHIFRSYLALCLSFDNNTLHHILYYYILGWITLPIKYLDLILSKFKNAESISFAFYYLGRKE